MSKMFRAEEAAARLRLSVRILDGFVEDGLIEPCKEHGGVRYFRQDALDRLIQEVHHRIQRASWRDMEERMEEVESKVESLTAELASIRKQGQHLL